MSQPPAAKTVAPKPSKSAATSQPGPAKGSAAEQARAYRRKKARGQFAGIPIIAWAMIGVGLLLAGGLAAYVLR